MSFIHVVKLLDLLHKTKKMHQENAINKKNSFALEIFIFFSQKTKNNGPSTALGSIDSL